MRIGDIETVHINGMEMLTVAKFAKLVNRSESSIRRLMSYGNRYRKLKKITLDGKPFIPVMELQKYPFTFQGRTKKDEQGIVYHYEIDPDEESGIRVAHTEWYCGTANPIRCDLNCPECKFGVEIECTSTQDEIEND